VTGFIAHLKYKSSQHIVLHIKTHLINVPHFPLQTTLQVKSCTQ